MKRKDYQMPTMQVVKLKQQYQILAGSPDNVDATMNDTWVEEEG